MGLDDKAMEDLLALKRANEQQRAEIDAALAKHKRAHIRELRLETARKCEALGITLAELLADTHKPDKRSTVQPRYKDPASGKSWSGRGTIPNWLRPKVAPGGVELTGEAREQALAPYLVKS